ncbi:hypothetical protein RF11_12905 [Thelohanellus kitauei]|uniref:Uncharacterized protein n=1 Tax=Thelohanellus kitauei TaxID=669202 RepID=A0A0C2MAX5_THEKT|nr:hypothetical protein RF11_12905 [Thelohanellus kitauei]
MIRVINFLVSLFLGSYYILNGTIKHIPKYFKGADLESKRLYGLCYDNVITRPLTFGLPIASFIKLVSTYQIVMGILILMPCPCGSMVGAVGLILQLCFTVACTRDNDLISQYLPLFSIIFCGLVIKILVDTKRFWDRRKLKQKKE